MVGLEVDTQTQEKPSLGPVCSECAKPIRLAAEKGGCGLKMSPH